MALVATSWPQLVLVGPGWSKLVPINPGWSQLAPVSPGWTRLGPFGSVWPHLALLGHVSPQLALVDPCWHRLAPASWTRVLLTTPLPLHRPNLKLTRFIYYHVTAILHMPSLGFWKVNLLFCHSHMPIDAE